MASAWGKSWGLAFGTAFGAVAAAPAPAQPMPAGGGRLQGMDFRMAPPQPRQRPQGQRRQFIALFSKAWL